MKTIAANALVLSAVLAANAAPVSNAKSAGDSVGQNAARGGKHGQGPPQYFVIEARSDGDDPTTLEVRHFNFWKGLHKALNVADTVLRRDDDSLQLDRRGQPGDKVVILALPPQGKRELDELERRGLFHLFRKLADGAVHGLEAVIPQSRDLSDIEPAEASSMGRRDLNGEEDNDKRGFGRLLHHAGTASDALSLGQTAWSFVHGRDLNGEEDNDKRGLGHLLHHAGTASDALSLGQTAWSFVHGRNVEDLVSRTHNHHGGRGGGQRWEKFAHGLSVAADGASLAQGFLR
ncbi:hypothetical protein OC844_002425 [Tilletia horrida]|nr:hypothetical protein OC844_002425 [Tilletia horrida]